MARKRNTPAGAWEKAILAFVRQHPDRPLKTRALARELDVASTDYTSFRVLIRALVDRGQLVLGPGRTLRMPEQSGLIIGTFRANPRGFGFVERPGEPSLYIPPGFTGRAMEGDQVAVRKLKQHGKMPGPRAEVVRIVEPAPQIWVGLLAEHRGRWFVQLQGREALPPIEIPEPGDAVAGELVVAEPLATGRNPERPVGRIVERLGDPRDARVQILAAMRRHSLPERFPTSVTRAARRVVERFKPEDLGERLDLREQFTVTIDPEDARDFDDAISLRSLRGARVELGVHIADVAHFVPQGGVVDQEALRRGTSVYFPGRVVPMLPEELSNGICSLQPDQSRFTKSVFIVYDAQGRVLETRFANSVIRSNVRLTYEQVTAALAGENVGVDARTVKFLRQAEALARRIRQRRLEHEMITLSLPEAEICVDADGHVTDAHPADTSFSHTIIEMFMVEANEAVSRRLTTLGLTHLRRIHPAPDPAEAEGLAMLGPVLKGPPPHALTRPEIRRLLDAVRGQPAETAVNYILLRSLPQATYSPAPEGHFALASDDYCHFTSPIRRYPDLTVHRLLDLVIRHAGHVPDDAPAVLSDVEWAELARQTTAAERRAQQASRQAEQALLTLYMRAHLGSVFEGVISGVTSFGVFVQLRVTMAEGLLRVGDFGSDEWVYDRQTSTYHGTWTQRLVCLGQPLRVMVAAVNELRQEVTLTPADGGPIGEPLAGGRPAGRRRGKPTAGRRKATGRGRTRSGRRGR